MSVHAHEGRRPRRNDATTPRFLRGFARYAVEAGADAVHGHGPHVLRGVELYEGAPICYSLGNFVAGSETVERLPAALYDRFGLDPLAALPADLFDAMTREGGDPDGARSGFAAERAFYESVVALPRWTDGDLARVEFLPVELGFEAPRPRRGRPRPAGGDRAPAILDRFADLSEPFGTDIRVEDGVGVVGP